MTQDLLLFISDGMKSPPTIPLPQDYSWDRHLRSGDETANLTARVWPRYLTEKSDIESAIAPTILTDEELSRRFAIWGIRRNSDAKLVAFASAVLISIDPEAASYPNEGWRYALNAYYAGGEANCLCLLSANVDPDFRSLKFSYSLVQEAKEVAKRMELSCVLAPVRPTQKSQFPLVPIAEYLAKTASDGGVFDPWLRVHAKLGGEILNVCSASVVVSASLSKWKDWLGVSVQKSEPLVPSLGLVPISVNWTDQSATYSEPNVWVRYRIDPE